jgi:hypothetical protein
MSTSLLVLVYLYFLLSQYVCTHSLKEQLYNTSAVTNVFVHEEQQTDKRHKIESLQDEKVVNPIMKEVVPRYVCWCVCVCFFACFRGE